MDLNYIFGLNCRKSKTLLSWPRHSFVAIGSLKTVLLPRLRSPNLRPIRLTMRQIHRSFDCLLYVSAVAWQKIEDTDLGLHA